MFNKTLEKRFALSCFLSPVEGKWLNILGQQGGGCKVNGGIGKNFRIGGGGGGILGLRGFQFMWVCTRSHNMSGEMAILGSIWGHELQELLLYVFNFALGEGVGGRSKSCC